MTINYLISNGKIVVQSQIRDTFYGFDDEMKFPLLNGQCWIQNEFKFCSHFAFMPVVTIYSINNVYYLNVKGRTEFVKVKLYSR